MPLNRNKTKVWVLCEGLFVAAFSGQALWVSTGIQKYYRKFFAYRDGQKEKEVLCKHTGLSRNGNQSFKMGKYHFTL